MKKVVLYFVLYIISLNGYSQSSIDSAWHFTFYNYLHYTPPPGSHAQLGPDYGCSSSLLTNPIWFWFEVCGTIDSVIASPRIGISTNGNNIGRVVMWGPFDDTINIANKLTAANIYKCKSLGPLGLIDLDSLQFPKFYYGMISFDSTTSFSQLNAQWTAGWYMDDRCGVSNSRVANYKQDICMVTLDSATQKNIIVWENKNNFQIASFNIYREGVVANQFDSIGNVLVSAHSSFIDYAVNPNQKSYKYAVTAIDSSGQTAFYYHSINHDSAIVHTTIHVQASAGLNNEVNLSWNAYSGFAYNTFYIYRGATSNNFQILDSVSATTFSYTDFNAPAGVNYYKVTVHRNGGCSPDGGSTIYYQAISNNPYALSVGLDELSKPAQFIISPNPSVDHIKISSANTINNGHITLYNSIGEIILEDLFRGSEKLLTCDLKTGIYLIKITGSEGSWYRKIIRQ